MTGRIQISYQNVLKILKIGCCTCAQSLVLQDLIISPTSHLSISAENSFKEQQNGCEHQYGNNHLSNVHCVNKHQYSIIPQPPRSSQIFVHRRLYHNDYSLSGKYMDCHWKHTCYRCFHKVRTITIDLSSNMQNYKRR